MVFIFLFLFFQDRCLSFSPISPPIHHNILRFHDSMATFLSSNSEVPVDQSIPAKSNSYDRLKSIVDGFPSSDFIPNTLIQSNCHWQTIVGSGALWGKIFGDPTRRFHTVPETIQTSDGDFFDVEYTDNIDSSSGIVVLLHGLEATIKGSQITNYVTAMLDKGFSCVLISFRSCNGQENLKLGAYHLGFTTDLTYMIDLINQRHPTKSLYLCGFSLGGNVILKYLGEQGDEAWRKNIRGAAVTCVPFDPVASQGKIDQGINRLIYSKVIMIFITSRLLLLPLIF